MCTVLCNTALCCYKTLKNKLHLWDIVLFQAIKEWEMYIVIVVCLLLDFILMMAWQLIDPMHVHLENFPSERPETTDQDIEILPQLQHCISDHLNIWFGQFHFYLLIHDDDDNDSCLDVSPNIRSHRASRAPSCKSSKKMCTLNPCYLTNEKSSAV